MITDKTILRTAVRTTYDMMKLRIATGNRIVMRFRDILGIPSTPSKDRESRSEVDSKEATLILEELRRQTAGIVPPPSPSELKKGAGAQVLTILLQCFDKITEGVVENMPSLKKFVPVGAITGYAELALLQTWKRLHAQETANFKTIKQLLGEFPIYTEFLAGVPGCGPAMSGVLVTEIDIHKSMYPSSIWMYAGLDVAADGKGRSRRAEHLVDVEYVNKKGATDVRKSITFNPFLKTKLFVLAGCFLKAKGSTYKVYYDNYKHRIENMPPHVEKTAAHRHMMAMRYMEKMFLLDLYKAWRPLEGLVVAPPYSEAKLGIHHRNPEATYDPFDGMEGDVDAEMDNLDDDGEAAA